MPSPDTESGFRKPSEPMDSLNHEKQGPEPTTTPALPSEEPPTQVSLDQSPDEKHVGPQTIPTLRLIAISTGYVSHPLFRPEPNPP
jgi:hypothetical protein